MCYKTAGFKKGSIHFTVYTSVNHYHTIPTQSRPPSAYIRIKGPAFSKDNETDGAIRQHTGNGDETI